MIGIAVIGAGTIGSVHVPNIHAHPDYQLRYIIDRDIERATRLAAGTGAVVDTSLDTALCDEDVAAVIIGSSTSAHHEHVLACAEAGKAFICEKPVADSLEGAIECCEAVNRAGVVAATGLNRRLDPDFQDINKRIRNGEIGTVEMIHIASRSTQPPTPESVPLSGGMLREKGSHFYDLACWYADAEPVEVFATGECLIEPRLAEYGDVDTAAIVLRLSTGAIATFDFGRRTSFGQDESIEVFGSQGMLVSGRKRAGNVDLYQGSQVTGSGIYYDPYGQFAQSYVDELTSFANAVTGKAPVHASLADGLRTQAVAEAAIRSLGERKMINIEKIW